MWCWLVDLDRYSKWTVLRKGFRHVMLVGLFGQVFQMDSPKKGIQSCDVGWSVWTGIPNGHSPKKGIQSCGVGCCVWTGIPDGHSPKKGIQSCVVGLFVWTGIPNGRSPYEEIQSAGQTT